MKQLKEGSLFYSPTIQRYIYSVRVGNKNKKITQRKNENERDFKQRCVEFANMTKTMFIPEGNDTLNSLLTNYLKQKYNDGYTSGRTYARHLVTLQELEECCHFMKKPVSKITPNDIENAKPNMQDYSPSTISKMWSMLKIGFNIAYHRHYIQYDLMNDITLKKPLSHKKTKKVSSLTKDERDKLKYILTHQEAEHKYSFIVLMQLATGMRIGELLARSYNDIDFNKGTIKVWNTLTRDVNGNVILGEHTKTYDKNANIDKGAREIPLTSNMLFELQKRLKNHSRANLTHINNFIFYNEKENKYITPSEVNCWLRRLNEKYHIAPQLSTHQMRHTRITELTEQHIHPIVIHYLAGHSDKSSITENVYTDVSLDFIKNELSKAN